MDRRKFCKNAIGGALALAVARLPGMTFAQTSQNTSAGGGESAGQSESSISKLRGVNLGGWLVLEKWMVPTVYRDSDAPDEYGLCLALGDQAKARLDGH